MTIDSEALTGGDLIVQTTQSADRAGVEAGRVGDVKYLPGEA